MILAHKLIKGSTLFEGDVLEALRRFPAESVQTCVTSPPYWGLRDYGVPGQLGLEPTPDEYVAHMVEVFREVRRALRADGTLWLNLGDTYRDKSLIGIPWLTAFALKNDGWYLRNEIIWHKPNAMPDGVKDRLTRDHEQLFLFAKSAQHYYDADSIREPQKWDGASGSRNYRPKETLTERVKAGQTNKANPLGRNRRTVWSVPTQPYKGSHIAVFPPALIEPCILAGAPVGGVVLDPFAGSGTTLAVAIQHNRRGVGIELNPAYIALAIERISAANNTALRGKGV